MTKQRFERERTRRLDALLDALEAEDRSFRDQWSELRERLGEVAGDLPGEDLCLALEERLDLGSAGGPGHEPARRRSDSRSAVRAPAPAATDPARVRV